ncbi:MAG: hypothetical protein IKF39_04055 [Oscillospiraceae bacterium]|nr:hypothetical protein [Oscillospiraceae bacterium]
MANPNVGMMYPVWAPLTAHTDGSMPTYGTGRVIQEARNATVTREYANNPLYGDDRIVDDDNGLTGLTMSFESTGLTDEDRVAMLGEEANANTTTGGQWVSDNETPWGGYGYIRKMRLDGVRSYEAWFTLKIKFQEESMATQTREGQITWGTPTLNGRAAGLIVDSSEIERYQLHKTFSTISAAKAWLNGLANIT